VQVVPVIDAHFENAYSIKVVYSANDAVFERYMQSVKRWLHFKPTLVELGSAPLKAEHWGMILGRLHGQAVRAGLYARRSDPAQCVRAQGGDLQDRRRRVR
jgi:hypothetical protein